MDLDLDISMRSPGAVSVADTSFDVPSLPPTSPDMVRTTSQNGKVDLSNLFFHSSSPDVNNDVQDYHVTREYEPSSPLAPSSAMMGRARSAQQSSSSSRPPSLGVGSKKRRSSEFDEEEHSSDDLTERVQPMAGVGAAPLQTGLLFDGPLSSSPPESPTHRRKSRCIERSMTLGNGLIGIGSGAFSNNGNGSSLSGAPQSVAPGSGSISNANATATSSTGKPILGGRRSLPKRPALAGLQQMSMLNGPTSRTVSSSAALGGGIGSRPPSASSSGQALQLPPNRRAFSATVPKHPQQALLGMALDPGSDDLDVGDASSDCELSMDSFGHEIDMTSHGRITKHHSVQQYQSQQQASPAHRAQMARRENIARSGNRHSAQARIGMGFGAGSGSGAPSPIRNVINGGGVARSLPGFGDSEADGKVLPCHKVREDGLMRISAQTLDDLLHGEFDDVIGSFSVIDCRFDYEHAGGHIPGAINLNTNEAIESALLVSGSEDGLFGGELPVPSRSGDGRSGKRVIVFHCEFSVKRAPTFAKHFRSKDRSLNGYVYPNIHYPEVYILEGGYSQYYSQFSVRLPFCLSRARNRGLIGSLLLESLQDRCDGSYVRMDDPAHLRARASELNDFRRWNRTRSFTYGELQRVSGQTNSTSSTQGMSSNQPAPSSNHQRPVSTDSHMIGGGSTMLGGFGKRPPLSTLHTLTEDGDSSCTSEPDPAESPCPPAGGKMFTKMAAPLMPLPFNATGFGTGMRPRGMQRALTTALVSARH